MRPRPLPLSDARRELDEKTKQQIETETADRWAARAIAAYERFAAAREAAWATASPETEAAALAWLMVGVDYEHEAIEHASEAGTLVEIRWTIEAAKEELGVPTSRPMNAPWQM
jgi:hypothetical protein